MDKWIEKLYMDLHEGGACTLFDEDKEKGVQILLGKVSEPDRDLISERYKLDMSYGEMGDIHGCTRQNMHKKMKRVLNGIRIDKCAWLMDGYGQYCGMRLDKCGLSKNVWGPLVRNGCLTLGELGDMGIAQVRKIRGIGDGGVGEIMREVGWLWGE